MDVVCSDEDLASLMIEATMWSDRRVGRFFNHLAEISLKPE